MKTKQISIGGVLIGGGAKIAVQSMLSLPSEKISENVEQARSLEWAGCDILRIAIPDIDSIALIPALKQAVNMPIVADIHFDWRLALESVAAGVDKVRINPGNIGADDRVKAVANACAAKGIPIRIGVNSGSIEKHILAKHGSATPAAMVESAFYHAELLEKFDFGDIVLSMKTHDVAEMISAYRLAAARTEYPLHLGLTHTGAPRLGMLKSAIAIGSLLADGIGDTIRVSLTDKPEAEIEAANDILRAVDMLPGPKIISCPTCGRTTSDVIGMTQIVDEALKKCTANITVAVMGCVVNGPGEAREADIGITGGKDKAMIFKKGKPFKALPQDEAVGFLLEEIERMNGTF